MKRLTYLTFLILIPLLAACGGREIAEPTAEITAPPAVTTVTPLLETAVPLPADTAVPPTQFPMEAPSSVLVEETAQQSPTAEPVNEPGSTAAIKHTVEVEEPVPLQVISGQTADGAYFYGSPDAPVTLFDYSDFL